VNALRTLWSRIAGRGRPGAVPPMPPEEREILQSAQTWFGDDALAYMFRDGDAAVLSVGGETVAYQVVRAEAGQTVRAGPYEIRVVALEARDGHDYVRVIVSAPGG